MSKRAVAAILLCWALTSAEMVSASLSALAVGSGRARAAQLPAGNAPTAAVVPANGTTVTVTWTAPIGGIPIAGYVIRSFDATSGVERPTGASCAGVITATSCAESGVPDGSWVYTVTPALSSWRGAQSARGNTVVVDATAPVVAVTFPATGATYSAPTWNAGCASSICGTAGDAGSGVASVALSVRQGPGNYWNGISFASPTEVLLAATGTTSWTFSFAASNFPASGAYTVRAVATDGAGNTAAASSTFTLDAVGPAISGLTLQNGGTIGFVGVNDAMNIAYSEALSPSSICSAWSGTGDQTLGGATVTLSHPVLTPNDVLTFSSPACTLHIGTVTSPTSYTTIATATLSPSTITWTAATRTLRIAFGNLSGGLAVLPTPPHNVTYTPDGGITDLAGNAISNAVFTATNQRF